MTAIIDVLIPTQCNIQQKMVLAELYIRLIKTDAGLNKRLLHIDPYNSYDIVAYEDIAEPAYYIDLQQIADNIKKLQITNVRYTDVIGYLLIALEQLIKLCEELHA
jgi:hypothetical protein